jgi:predicted PurR-regulated permease PerM
MANDLPSFPVRSSRFSSHALVGVAVIIAGLYFGRDLLIPLALAVLLAFALDPLVTRLKRWGVPRAAGVALTVALAMSALILTSLFVASQIRDLGQGLPTYQANITQKLRDLRTSMREPGVFEPLTRAFGTVNKEIEATRREIEQRSRESQGATRPEPTRVEIVGQASTPSQVIADWADSVAGPAATLGLVLLFLVLVLMNQSDLRDRLVKLLGGNLHRSTDALGEAGERVSRYLLMQLTVNALYSVPLAMGLYLLGIPGAILWGLLSGVLRFVPYLGPVIAAVFPVLLAFAIDPGWNTLLWTVGLIVLLELLSNNIIEPWLYGSSTGMSALSLILAASFWTLLWGPVGLALSTPLTVCLLVLGRNIPQLSFLEVLLGSEPVLDPPTRLYQRLLAGDEDEIVELMDETVARTSVAGFYDSVALPAMCMASRSHTHLSTSEHRLRVATGMQRVIDELREDHPVADRAPLQVMCLGGRWEIDAMAAAIVAHAIGLQRETVPISAAVGSTHDLAALDLRGAKVLCLSYFAPDPRPHVKTMVRRLRRRWPEAKIVVGLWNVDPAIAEDLVAGALGVDALGFTLHEVLQQIEWCVDALGVGVEAGFLPAAIPENEGARLEALRRSGVLDPVLRELMDAVAARAADVFDTRLGLVNIINAEQQLTHGDSSLAGRRGDAEARPFGTREQSLCGHVVAGGQSMVINDVLRDTRFAGNPLLLEHGIRFYAGAPLVAEGGYVLGSLCLLDKRPRVFTDRERLLLESMATDLMRQVAERHRDTASEPSSPMPPAPDAAGMSFGGAQPA